MIKRTAEKVWSIIGIIITVIIGFLGAGALVLSSNEVFKSRLTENLKTIKSSTDTSSIVETMSKSGNLLIFSAAITVVLAIIALFNLKSDSRASLAGILFIVSGAVVLISSLFIGFLPAVMFFIAGVLCLVRKPKQIEGAYNTEEYRN